MLHILNWYKNAPGLFWHRLLLCAISIAFIAQGLVYIAFLNIFPLEILTLYGGWLTVDQGLVPYRDFHVGYTPLSLYLYGVFQSWLGPSFYLGRLEAGVFAGLMLASTYFFAARFGGRWAGLIALGLIVGNVVALQGYFWATVYSPSALFIIASLVVLTSTLKNPVRSIISVGIMSLAVLTRQDMVLFLALLVLFILLTEGWRSAAFWSALGTATIFPLLIWSPFLLYDWDASFGNIYYSMRVPSDMYGIATGSSALFYQLRVWPELIRTFFIVLLFLLSIGMTVLASKKEDVIQFSKKHRVLVLAGTIVAGHILIRFGPFYPLWARVDHMLFVLPVAAALVGIATVRLLHRIEDRTVKVLLISLLVFGTGLSAVLPAEFKVDNIPNISGLRSGNTELKQLKIAAATVEAYTKPTDRIFGISDNAVALMAKRRSLDATEFTAVVFSKRTDWAKRYHFINTEIVAEWLSGEAEVVLMGPKQKAHLLSPWFSGSEMPELVARKLRENYTLVAVEPEAYMGPLEIYLRNDLIGR